MNWFLQALQRYAEFGGRSRRSEFWYFILFSTIISLILSFLDEAIGFTFDDTGFFGALSSIYSLAILIPSIAVGVRRLHDTGRTGWWYLLLLVPFIGIIVLIIFWVQDGEPGTNKWGRNPKESGEDILDHLVDDMT